MSQGLLAIIDMLTLLMIIAFAGSAILLIVFLAMKRGSDYTIAMGICVGVSAGYLVFMTLIAQTCYRREGEGLTLFLWGR